tara:strand:- start:104 stop:295 length:192 start_codon:yes stop_codon:yes gene_type:complete
MRVLDRLPSLAFVIAIALGLALVVYALISGSDAGVVIGMLGLVLAGRATLTLVKRFGASDQPQ